MMISCYKSLFSVCLFLLFGTAGIHATPESPPKNLNEEKEMLSQCNGTQIAYWSLDNCVSFGNDGSNYDYSELTGSTTTPNGFSSVNATNLTGDGAHSCVYGESGAGFCHGIRNNCSWTDNANEAVKVTVTVNPSNGYTANITKLSFYESAPHSYVHLSGNSGDNDPPTKYGIRVLKNGQEIFQSTENSTSANWSLEQFDFSNDPDFTVSSNTTFTFEFLGYCRNGSNGLAVWDLDEIKVFGCSESTDPCAGQGGDSDGDGVCNNQDCQPSNPNFPATPGASCSDGNPNTQNDMVTADGCGCEGTPVGPPCEVTVGNCSITITGLDSGDYSKVFDSNWNIVWECNPWLNGGCSATETITDLSNGTYHVQACGETTSYTVSGCVTDPCAGQGGDSDGDGVCDNQDCQPNNPNFPATPGASCNDGNPNTQNDMVTSDGCGCEGTPVGPPCDVTVGNCSITITGLDSGDYSKVFDSNWNIVWECNPWANGGCSATETITNLSNGTYHVQACGETTSYTVSGCTTDPCAGQGGDSDGDGICDNQDCQPNDANYPATPGSSCNDGNPNTENDMVTSDGCGCEGTPTGPSCNVTVGNCSITISGLNNSDYIKVFDSNWNVVWDCNPWDNGGCSSTETITNLSNGEYFVKACGETTSYTVSGCTTDPCAGQGGDSDGDGVCNNADCQPNNPNFPATPGSYCNDGNPDTENDMVTADGCGCEGTPVGSPCNVTVGNCSITITGLDSGDYSKIFDSNWNIIWDCNPWANGGCNATETITNLSNGTYHVQACGETTSYTVSGCTTDPCAGQGGDSDGDGVCNNQDCQPNNPNFPATPGSSCNDGNPNTQNDMVTSDGCGCEGTPVNPCAGLGGDSDGDGVCNDQDCQPNNPSFPATPGSSCNDGNPNTQNDMVTSDGCGCEGSPVGPPCEVTVGNCSIIITGLNSGDYSKVFDSNWNIVWDCNPWGNNVCDATETITNLSNGTYFVQACGETTAYTVSGCTTDPCAGQGGDSDGDGVCNNQDCQPNNPNFPATPGSSCNDGNPDTENDMVTSDGCGCAGTPVDVCNPSVLAHWSMNDCESFTSNGSNTDFSEFTASTNTPSGISIVNASILDHDDGVHSCTEGQSGYAICSGTRTSCSWSDNSDDAFKFSITVKPNNGGVASITNLSFYERAPETFVHISGNTGDNDPPSHYGFRVLKNGQEIYQNTGNNTSQHWSLEQFDFSNDPDFVISGQTTFEFELLGYCRQGSGGLAAWDLDEIKVSGCGGNAYNSNSTSNSVAGSLNFSAERDGIAVQLAWITNTDYINEYFEVERSVDGVNFEILEEVMSASDSESFMNYQEKDTEVAVGANYYRVKQVHTDGSFRYSEIRKVDFNTDSKEFVVFPNPTADDCFVNLKDFEGMSGTVTLFNSLGQPIHTQFLPEIPATPIAISTVEARAGVHMVSVQIEDRKIMTKVLLITKL